MYCVTTSAKSAVVTRRSEPTITRILAGFCEFSVSDAMLNALFVLEAKVLPEPLRTPAALSGNNLALERGTYHWTRVCNRGSVISMIRSRCGKAVPGRGQPAWGQSLLCMLFGPSRD